MGLAILILGLAIFIGAHVFVSLRGHREQLIARIGEGPYKGAFSLVSILGLVLIVYGFALYRRSGPIPVWYPPDFLRHVSEALMWPAFVLVAAAYIPGQIKKTLKHPMLAGVKLWAFAHLLANGRLAGMVLFGSFLAWAVADYISARRRDRAAGVVYPVGNVSRDALAVVEVGAREGFVAPAGFALIDDRVYGAARLVFLHREATLA